MLHHHGHLPSPRCPFCIEDEDFLHPSSDVLGSHPCSWPWVCRRPPRFATYRMCFATTFVVQAPLVRHTLVMLLLWITWKSRNTMVFDAIRLSPRQTISLVLSHGELWLHRLPRRSSCLPWKRGSLFYVRCWKGYVVVIFDPHACITLIPPPPTNMYFSSCCQF
jgi:hypothetical protein